MGTINLAKSVRKLLESTFRQGSGSVRLRSFRGIEAAFTIVMDEAHDYGILGDLDPDDIFPEVVSFGDELSTIMQTQLTPEQEVAIDDHLVECLARMVFGSTMIESAGAGLDITLKLCQAIFRGEQVPEVIEERDPEYQALKSDLMRKNLPANTRAVLRSRREIVQHAKATSFIIHEMCIRGKDLTEDIILETHRILTYKVDAEDLPRSMYSGVYRSGDVRAGLHQFPDPQQVPYMMQGLIRDLESDLEKANSTKEIDPFALAAKYCHKFVNIHPGNGRTCRLILNAILLKLGGTIVCIGEQGDDRSHYENIAMRASMHEATYEGLEEDEKPESCKGLASFTLMHAKESIRHLIHAIKLKS